MITVIYRFRLKEGTEALYTACWNTLVTYLKDNRGAIGSRLHRSLDDPRLMIAYSQWPNKEVYDKTWGEGVFDSLDLPPAVKEAWEKMGDYVESKETHEMMELRVDRLGKEEEAVIAGGAGRTVSPLRAAREANREAGGAVLTL